MKITLAHVKNLDKTHRLLLFSAILIPPPISLNTLIEICGLSPVTVLNFMDNLIRDKIFSALKTEGLGIYKVRNQCLKQKIIELYPFQEVLDVSRKLLAWVDRTKYKKIHKSLIITNIISEIGYLDDFLVQHVLDSARYCLDLGDLEASTIYYNNIYSYLKKKGNNRELLVDSVLGIISANGHIRPLERQESILIEVRENAIECNDDARRCLVNLRIAQVYKLTGDYDKASFFYEEAWDLAKNLDRSDLLREAALFTSDFLFWKGLIADAISRYEDVLGDIERFPADQATLHAAATLGWCYGINGQIARGAGLIETVRNRAIELKMAQVKTYADYMSLLIFMEARRSDEAERHLNSVLNSPGEIAGKYTLRGSYAAKAFLLCEKGDYKHSYDYLVKTQEKSIETGWRHHRGPWNFDLMDILESKGYMIPEWNYDSEMKRLSEWPDVYMRGVGLRYRAQRALKKDIEQKNIFSDLNKSIELLSLAGANLELARTKLLLARLHLQRGKDKIAVPLMRDAWKTISSVNPDSFPNELKPFIEKEKTEEFFINTLSEVINTIGTVRDRDRILERIISLLIKLTFAGRGAFFLIQKDGSIALAASRNLDTAGFESPAYSKIGDMVSEVAKNKKKIIKVRDNPQSGWLMCYPIMLGDDLLGVLYLDNRLIGLTPPTKTLSLLSLIGSQVAIAIDNANAYQEIKYLKDRSEEETKLYRQEMKIDDSTEIIGDSEKIRSVISKTKKISDTSASVLVTGETGVGKELVAKAIHNGNQHSECPFIPVNASSLDPNLISSELFGHEKGAFTGATGLRRGRFELADGGTLFLDEIDTISLDLQSKLLRAIQEKEFERVGGTKTIKSNFRLIAATNQDLKRLVKKGFFREDLFYRINVFPIHVPPLRERKEDIPCLSEHFLKLYSKKFNKNFTPINQNEMEKLLAYHWPGNVRELRHVIERAVILSENGILLLPDFNESPQSTNSSQRLESLTKMERSHIIKALNICNWKISGKGGAAELLEIKAPTLYARMRKLKIQKKFS